MESPSANFEDSLVARAKQVIGAYVWEAFYERSHELRPMGSGFGNADFLGRYFEIC